MGSRVGRYACTVVGDLLCLADVEGVLMLLLMMAMRDDDDVVVDGCLCLVVRHLPVCLLLLPPGR